MQLGVMLEGQEGINWRRWRHLSALVEELGFGSLWRSDHFCSLMGRPERDALETWVSLAELAGRGTRLQFGPLVCSMTFREPSLLARMAAAVDDLSGGKLVLGVGAGWNVPEHQAFGLPFPALGKRMDQLEEGIAVIKALWTGEPVSYNGNRYTLDRAQSHPRPAQRPHPPILVGGGGEKRTLRIVAEHADEWNAINLLPDAYRAKTAILERHCTAVAREPRSIKRSMMCAFIIGNGDAALQQHVAGLQQMLPALAAQPAESVPGAMRERGWLVGDTEAIAAQIRELQSAGVERIMPQHHDQTNDEVLRLIAREVLPAVS